MKSIALKAILLFSIICLSTGYSLDDDPAGGNTIVEDIPRKCLNISLAPGRRTIYDYNSYDPVNVARQTQEAEMKYYLLDSYGNKIVSSNSTSSRICYNNDNNCQYLFLQGHGSFEVIIEAEHVEAEDITTHEGDLVFSRPKLIRMGTCTHRCNEQEQQLVFVGENTGDKSGLYDRTKTPTEFYEVFQETMLMENEETLNYEVEFQRHENDSNNDNVESNNNDDLIMRTMCLNPTGCYKLAGSAVYMLSSSNSSNGNAGDSVIEEEGTTYDGWNIIGSTDSCYQRCFEKPLLVETSRGQEITLALASISGMQALTDVNSPQYAAACWLIHDDLRQVLATDRNIIQRYILALLYFTLNGTDWNSNYDFLTHKHECEWSKWTYFSWLRFFFRDGNGVNCNENDKVSRIVLVENNVVGALPPEISWLTEVDYLDFSRNVLHGTVPPDVGRMTNLKQIRFRSNGLTGSLPPSLGEIDTLQVVDFGNNILEGNMISIPNHCDLRFIELRNNLISSTIPNEIGRCSLLTVLSLQSNVVTGTIPNSIGDLAHLDRVKFHVNSLSGTIPSGIFNKPNLTQFWVNGNAMTGTIPNDIIDGSKLWIFLLNDNSLTGQVPPTFSHLSGVVYLYLQNNALTGEIPSALTQLESLAEFRIQRNEITGNVPFDNCEQFDILEADCGSPNKVVCPCCSGCHGIFSTFDDGSVCPSTVITLQFDDLSPGYWVDFETKSSSGEVLDHYYFSADGTSHTYTTCIPDSGCIEVQFLAWVNLPFELTILANDVVVMGETVTEPLSEYHVGYSSSEGGMQKDTCDGYELCNVVAESNSGMRGLVDRLTRITGEDVFDDLESPYYRAACEWAKFLEEKSHDNFMQSTLLQHYFLALIYFTTEGENWSNSSLWFTNETSFCSWYGISCDSYHIITSLDLNYNNLRGTIPTEIAELRGLEQLILSYNHVSGTIPSEIGNLRRLQQLRASDNMLIGSLPSQVGFLGFLQELDLSYNQLADNLPTEIGNIGSALTECNLFNNTFSGELPDSFYELTNLKLLSLGSNLFAGDAGHVKRFLDLETLDLRDNFFTGTIPLSAFQNQLQVLQLSGNEFFGSIPISIGRLQLLEELFLYNNELTGNIPSQLGNLENLTLCSLSYNRIKGFIPSELGNLRNLSLLHLHNNNLEGSGDHFSSPISDYITDCGSTFTSAALVDCVSCTSCCNIEGDCLSKSITWPRPGEMVLSSNMPPRAFVFLMTLASSFALSAFLYILSFLCGKGDIGFSEEFQEESTYKFLLSKNLWAKCFSVVTVLLQLFLLSIFIEASDFTSVRNDWEYSMSCPENSVYCEDKRGITPLAWLAFSCILGCYLLKDFLEGSKMVYESIILKSFKGVFAGFVVIFVTIASIVASVLYNYSTGISSTDILKDAVILLFLNDIDEQLYTLIRVARPKWVEERNNSVERWLDKKIRESVFVSSRQLAAFGLDDEDSDDASGQEPSNTSGQEPGKENRKDENTVGKDYIQLLEKEINNLYTDHIHVKNIYEKEIYMHKQVISDHKNEINQNRIEIRELKNTLTALGENHDELQSKHAALEKEVNDLKKSFLVSRDGNN